MHTPVPAAVVPPQAVTSRRSQATRQTVKFGIGVPPDALTWMQPPVFGAVHALPGLSQNEWHVPNTHESPSAQPAVATHGAPIGALPAVTHPTLPLESSTSQVSASVHPH
jgi:hypothetical protein